ncbi:MAG: hypothetical protein ABJB69_03310 [Spartobacteria bacterium]
MKRRFFSRVLMLGLAAGALILTGCSTTESRISEHQDIYNSMSARDQALISRGEIRSGMSEQAVWMAWGSPEQKTSGEMRGRSTETWIYVQTTSAPYGSSHYPYYGYPYGYGYGGFGAVGFSRRSHHGRSFVVFGDPFYDPFYYSYIPPTISIPYRTVTFSNGRVMSFQYLVRPR